MRHFIVFLCTINLLHAQNLVVNPGFEKSETATSSVIVNAGVEGWSAPSAGTTDYIRPTQKERKEQSPDLPSYAHIIPYEGKACAGFHGDAGGYEYLCGTLSSALVKDSVYTISFALATVFDYEFYPKRIGIYFTGDEHPYYRPAEHPYRIELTPNVNLDTPEVISENGHWKIYSLKYKASGTEKRFIIGDFTTIYEIGLRDGKEANYFFLDNISIIATGYEQSESKPDSVLITPLTKTSVEDTFIAAGKTLVLENIYFETNKSRILSESYQPLYDIIVEMKLQPNLKVEIVGHTDKHGDPKTNQKLSEARAKAVADFFVSKGIDASRITTRGEGSNRPVSDEDQKNRRVEFNFSE